jgi:signal transduction histidine kinase
MISVNTRDNYSNQLHYQCDLVVRNILTGFFATDITESSVQALRTTLKTIADSESRRIFIIDRKGVILIDTQLSAEGADINLINPSFLENTIATNVTLGRIFPEPVIAAVDSIPYNYTIRGYVCISIPVATVQEQIDSAIDTFFFILLIVIILFALILGILFYLVVVPVRKLTHLARNYSSGRFTDKTKLTANDEFGDLYKSITAMGSEIRKMDGYQKSFVANISHDFRSPLTSIQGYATALKDGTIQYEDKDHYLDIILFETDRLSKLTSSLLTLNNFGASAKSLDLRVFDINLAIRSTAASFEVICLKKSIKIKLLFTEHDMPVLADMSMIQQVLYNLIDNAVKFSHNDADLIISTEDRNGKVYVSVKDFGVGIPSDSIKKIWERFYKSDPSRGKDKLGTGLGLSIVKEIIAAHGEMIDVTSTAGAGTEFVFSLKKAE